MSFFQKSRFGNYSCNGDKCIDDDIGKYVTESTCQYNCPADAVYCSSSGGCTSDCSGVNCQDHGPGPKVGQPGMGGRHAPVFGKYASTKECKENCRSYNCVSGKCVQYEAPSGLPNDSLYPRKGDSSYEELWCGNDPGSGLGCPGQYCKFYCEGDQYNPSCSQFPSGVEPRPYYCDSKESFTDNGNLNIPGLCDLPPAARPLVYDAGCRTGWDGETCNPGVECINDHWPSFVGPLGPLCNSHCENTLYASGDDKDKYIRLLIMVLVIFLAFTMCSNKLKKI